MPPKDPEFSQFARVALDGDQLNPPSQTQKASNDGTELLGDGYGRLWARLVGGMPAPPFGTRGQVSTAFTGNTNGRLFFAGAGVSESIVVWTQSIEGVFLDPGIFLMVFDAVALPANGAVPLVSVPVAANNVPMSITMGIEVATGLFVVLSDTNGVIFQQFVGAVPNRGFISQGVVFT